MREEEEEEGGGERRRRRKGSRTDTTVSILCRKQMSVYVIK